MKVLISAAEASSDTHGAQLLRAMKAISPDIEAFGIGGPHLTNEGLQVVVDARELLVMGFHEVFGRLPRILRALEKITRAVELEKPDIAVVIDYPEFHFRLAKRLQELGVPVVYYIPPKVWVWRKGRIKVLKERFAAILSILPFEMPFYHKAGLAVQYVGNPLIDELPLHLTRVEARQKLGIDLKRPALVLMPGSRPSELNQHFELMLDAAFLLCARMREQRRLAEGERLLVLIPLPLTTDLSMGQERLLHWQKACADQTLEVRLSQGDSFECMAAGDVGLIKSGTSTLEAGLLGLPHAVVYRPSWLTGWLFQNLVRYRGPVGLVNLVSEGYGEKPNYLMKELLCQNATAEKLACEAELLFSDLEYRAKIQLGLSRLPEILRSGAKNSSPSRVAAEAVFRLIKVGSSK